MKDQRMKGKNSRDGRDACTDAANTICKTTSYNGSFLLKKFENSGYKKVGYGGHLVFQNEG